MSEPKKFDAVLDVFFAQLQPVLDAGFTSLANSLKKSVEELTEEEIHTVVDAAAQMYMESMIQALALAQQVPEIAGVAKKNASHSDFNKSVADNHDKIDFDRKWDHTRTKFGAPLSLDELATSDPSALEEGHSMFETNDEEYDRLENQFLDTFTTPDGHKCRDNKPFAEQLLRKNLEIYYLLGGCESGLAEQYQQFENRLHPKHGYTVGEGLFSLMKSLLETMPYEGCFTPPVEGYQIDKLTVMELEMLGIKVEPKALLQYSAYSTQEEDQGFGFYL